MTLLKMRHLKAEDPAALGDDILRRDRSLRMSLLQCSEETCSLLRGGILNDMPPEFSRVIVGLVARQLLVHFEEFFTTITGNSLKSHLYRLTRQSQPFDNGAYLK